jgi:hypothetical protein
MNSGFVKKTCTDGRCASESRIEIHPGPGVKSRVGGRSAQKNLDYRSNNRKKTAFPDADSRS